MFIYEPRFPFFFILIDNLSSHSALKSLNDQRLMVIVDKATMHILRVIEHLELASTVKADGQDVAGG